MWWLRCLNSNRVAYVFTSLNILSLSPHTNAHFARISIFLEAIPIVRWQLLDSCNKGDYPTTTSFTVPMPQHFSQTFRWLFGQHFVSNRNSKYQKPKANTHIVLDGHRVHLYCWHVSQCVSFAFSMVVDCRRRLPLHAPTIDTFQWVFIVLLVYH